MEFGFSRDVTEQIYKENNLDELETANALMAKLEED